MRWPALVLTHVVAFGIGLFVAGLIEEASFIRLKAELKDEGIDLDAIKRDLIAEMEAEGGVRAVTHVSRIRGD